MSVPFEAAPPPPPPPPPQQPSHRPSSSARAAGGFGLSAFGVLLLIAMAMPWVGLSCAGTPLLEQNGFQVVVGAASPANPAMRKSPEQLAKENTKNGESIAAWWLALTLLGAIGAGALGVAIARGKDAHARPALALSTVSALVLSGSLIARLPLERKIEDVTASMTKVQRREGLGGALGIALTTERRGGVWLALASVWGQALLAAYLEVARRRDRGAG
jgi:hypothetical protein